MKKVIWILTGFKIFEVIFTTILGLTLLVWVVGEFIYFREPINVVNANFKEEISFKKPVKSSFIFETPNAFRFADEFSVFFYEQDDNEDIIRQLENSDLKHLENQILVCKKNFKSEFYHLFEDNFPKEVNNNTNLYYKIKTSRSSKTILVYDTSTYKLYYIECYFKT